MKSTSSILAVLAAATTALAGTVVVKNNCPASIYLTITRSTQQSTTMPIAAGTSYSETIVGQGNSFGVTQNAEYFSPNTPKLIWGFSDAPPTLYYSLSTVDGSPYPTISLSSTDASCGVVTSPDARTRTCNDGNTFTLQIC